MRPPVETKTAGTRRIVAGLGALVVFGVLFVLPLCAALALCTMPCCHDENGERATVMSAMSCDSECGMQSADSTPPPVVASVAPDNDVAKRLAPAVAEVHLPAAPAVAIASRREARPSPGGNVASLQVLNSVFRI